MKLRAVDQLRTKCDDLAALGTAQHPVSVKLGGTTLWAAGQDVLDTGIRELQAAIEDVASKQLAATRAILKKLARESLGTVGIDDRVFSAVLGAALRSGRIDSLVCGSKNDKSFRVFIHIAQLARWREVSEIAMILLQAKGTLVVRDLERQIFPARAYNTWSSTLHVLQHLNYRGVVQFTDDDTVRLVRDLV